MKDPYDRIGSGGNLLALHVDLFPVEACHRYGLARLNGYGSEYLGARGEGCGYVCEDEVVCSAVYLELEAAAGICKVEGCRLCSLVCGVEFSVHRVAENVRVLVSDHGIGDDRGCRADGEGIGSRGIS